jgi:hypothetical protein
MTTNDIDLLIEELVNLRILTKKREQINVADNKFALKIPITGKTIEVSIPKEDIDKIDNDIAVSLDKITNKMGSIKKA